MSPPIGDICADGRASVTSVIFIALVFAFARRWALVVTAATAIVLQDVAEESPVPL